MPQKFDRTVEFRLSSDTYDDIEDVIEDNPQFENVSQFLRYATKHGIKSVREFSSST